MVAYFSIEQLRYMLQNGSAILDFLKLSFWQSVHLRDPFDIILLNFVDISLTIAEISRCSHFSVKYKKSLDGDA